MKLWRGLLKYSKQAQKDSLKLASVGLKGKTEKLLAILAENPYQSPPNFEKLKGTVTPVYSRRINLQHRLVYQVFEEKKIVRILRMWTHYGE
ncbi:MAG: Txe/YoeB family addiction module toxin [Microcystis panniformis Mp_MB_F_20051200_S9]|uniref:Endoribonuclease YoeB n=1 Tax=Microcystis panniformis Mp_MB_F_20051200_S9 TaxID=2486223 RepID=A0A552PUG4_9CHRO|nr:MAG: Txe/YoeB family addiction module toxin [Microcystis panniformis Mp_MB_F_20080800_S26D]TRV50368.1 MAG: Txe/YoeB family addiction module toxin [Microcystis panniformis Mp_GB_SS_20050300_S99]TRV55154.1 MAG: Txe/YoeB family addiction module toxin [Microcystis panniformis Mp_GB_SS_20050300_S99D]TRV60619.1 MAG: Txe/YoeB family addiction module toxin [Microcystis panniformis Mp_MB_F_20051200_S9]TRV64435.1 MAG: Txe/YoeB family addiction module toxin [Microcystis panniformis Mp_MB_F_20080800_S26